jgi:hypothetical protein
MKRVPLPSRGPLSVTPKGVTEKPPLRAELIGADTCTCEAFDLSVSSRVPVLGLARELIARGIDPATPLEVYRGMTMSLRVRIGEGAKLTVFEGSSRPYFAVWTPWEGPSVRKTVAPGSANSASGYRDSPPPLPTSPRGSRETAIERSMRRQAL